LPPTRPGSAHLADGRLQILVTDGRYSYQELPRSRRATTSPVHCPLRTSSHLRWWR